MNSGGEILGEYYERSILRGSFQTYATSNIQCMIV